MEEIGTVNDTVMETSSVRGKRISVIGAARSGLAVAQLLRQRGAIVFVTDSSREELLASSTSVLRSLGIEVETGAHTKRALDSDLIVVSPGIPSTLPILREAEGRGVKIISELELASWFCRAPIIGVTGTNGKTTTTSLIGRIFHDAKRRHYVGGNIGIPFSSLIPDLDENAVAILEISSFQLDHISSFRPRVSVLLNITPDHLDRYEGNFEKYVESKCRIFKNQTIQDYLLYNFDDEQIFNHVKRLATTHVRAIPFGLQQRYGEGAFIEQGKLVTVFEKKRSEIIEIDRISIRGVHNLYNSMAATLVGVIFNIPVPSLRATLSNFKGIEHRLEFVRELHGVTYVNDSKATNTDSVAYALQSFKQPIILMLGGRDKGNDYSLLHALVRKHVRSVVAIGESADKVYHAFSGVVKVVKAHSMQEAVHTASSLASPGDVVLLSPACASFDWFENYEHRGRSFKQFVNSL